VDALFLDLVRELMGRLRMKVRICDATCAEDAEPFSLDRIADFLASAERCIAVRRAEWIAAFGAEQLRATTNEVHARLILPRCRERVKRAGITSSRTWIITNRSGRA
jgi:hypothetical protein